MAQSRESQKAMFAKMGIGAKVELTKKFGIGDIPVGSVGTIDGHVFGREQPSVKFPQGRFIVDAEKLKVLKASKNFIPRNTSVIDVKGSKESLLKKIRDSGQFANITPDGFFSGSIHLDDGEGGTGEATFRGKIADNKISVNMNKNDIPNRWVSQFETLSDQAVETVADAVGVEEP